ncbi:MAG: BlaI/MecI/CopY family transcriptional regulator [Armatimonadota bacterium]
MRLPDNYLSRREQQILEILYRESPLLAAQVRERLPDSPGNSAVRKLLSNLEEKGSIHHTEVDGRFLYAPTFPRVEAGKSILENVVETFFAGSLSQTIAALLTGGSRLSETERERIQKLIEQAENAEQKEEPG